MRLFAATHQKFPVSAVANLANGPSSGLANGHAYAVLGAYVVASRGDVVKLFNPCRKDSNAQAYGDGVFYMTKEEFHSAFDLTTVTAMTQGYRTTAKTIR